MPFTFKLSQRLARMRCTALVLTAAALAACEKPIQLTDPGNTVAQVVVSPRAVTLRTNQMVDLMAVGLATSGDTVPLSITWSVAIGTITDTSTSGGRHYGRYKAGSDTGKVKVIAKGLGGGSDTATVTVTPVPISTVTINPAAASVLAGQTAQLAATTLDSAGNVLTGRTVTWTSASSSIAMVNGSGLLTGVAAGSTTITAASEGKSGTASIAVSNVPVATVTVSPVAASLPVGGTQQFTAIPKDANGNPLTGRTITWTSSNSGVATVSGSGLVSAGSAGSAVVTATSEGQSGTGTVTVTAPAPVPVATVTVSPATASVTVGATQQFAATLKDANGNLLSGRTITWTSSNSGVATVSASGLAGAGAAGSAVVTATSEGKSGTATVTVTAPPPPAPGAVADLAAAGATDTSVTLTFTEVNDGTGNPASYDVRYAAGAISWGSATEVSRGTCATPVAGMTIGARRTCTVLGLSSSTAYGFQLSAFRGTLNVNAVFGGLSNVASGTTAAGAPQPVASVVVSPTTASVGVGGTQQFTATLRDANGTVLTGRATSWTSSVQSIASVSAGGLVTALLAGTTTITATSEGQSGTATMTVTALPPPSTGWTNQPAGYTTVTDQPWDGLTTLGWNSIYNTNGYVSIVGDATAPLSPGNVIQYRYPSGFAAGSAPGTEWLGLPSLTRAYVGLWWKASNPWQGNPTGVNKIEYLFSNSQGSIFLCMYGPPGGPYELRVFPQFTVSQDVWLTPNVTHVPVTLGQWHKIEWVVDYNGGVVKWWLDGQLIGSYTGVPMPSSSLVEHHLTPVWGGVDGVKSETDYFWYDHIRISGN